MEKFTEPFTYDMEKLRDMLYLSKEEFLNSYSYLTEEEYENTVKAVMDIIGGKSNMQEFYKVYAGGQYIADTIYADSKEEAYEQIADEDDYILYTPAEYEHWFGTPEDDDYEPDVDECGFDPYEGCYTFDC